MSLNHIILIPLLATSCMGSHFRGGLFTWEPTEHESQIQISYRMSWRRSSGHFCDNSHISSSQLFGGGSLVCVEGCTGTMTQLVYYCTDFSVSEDWTTGTRTFVYDLTTASTEISFTFTGCCWISLISGGSNWALKTKASVAKRADTGKINSSPTTSVSPIVRVSHGCNVTINLLVSDSDGDTVRCRWSNQYDECGDICLSFSGAVLNKDTCTISYQATGSVGYYGVAVQVEDFPATGGTVPYSSIPVQFLVDVYSTSQGCYSLPEFISPTRDDQEVVYITGNVYFDQIVAISNVPNTSIEEITTVSPSGFIKSALAEHPDVPGAWYVNITWNPTMSDVNKIRIFCFTATDKMRLTSQQRCINLIATPDVVFNGSKGIQFQYGLGNDDNLMGVNDGKCKLISKEYEFPMFRSTYSKIFVCITGIVTFDEPFESPGTVDGSDLKGRAILAPYFNDIDRDSLRHGGNVYYHVYNSVKGDINDSSNVRTAQEIIQGIHGDVGNFKAQFALFVTWHQVRPSGAKSGQNERMNFQLALVTDGVYTFAFYVYPKNGMKLQSQHVYIGFTTKDGQKHMDYRSFTSSVRSIDAFAISFGYAGLLHYRLSFPSLGPKSSRQDCIDWYLNERKNKDEYHEGLEKMPLCPCDTSHLVRDQFYSNNDYFYQGNAFCTYIRPNWQFRPKDSGKTCCYDKTYQYFIGYGSDSGGFVRYHPYRQALKHKSYDGDMRRACCEENNLCSLYHSVRPIGQCYKIFPAWHAPARGDPHFKTLDGQNYTFNGWGEFTLVKINSSTEEFELQARTSRIVRKDVNMSDATAFSAFAAREKNNANVHVELNATNNGLVVYAQMAPGQMLSDYTSDYTNMDKEFNFASDYMSLSRSNQTQNVIAVFASGVAFTVGVSVSMLNIDVLIPNKFLNMTAGLLGNFDGDPTNDFQFKNGTILWDDIREKDIFDFGKSWAVDPDQSAFWYPQGKGYYDYSHLNYTPAFLEDLDAVKVASARYVCGEEEYECIFDFVLTEDEEVANETRRLGDVARKSDAVLKNEAPRISGPATVNVTINNTMTYQVNAFDDGELRYQLLDGQMYANISDLTNGTALVTLLLQEDRPINVKTTVVDKFGVLATPHQLVIVVCSTCNQRGTCDFAEFRDDNRTTDTFKYGTCKCDPYWDGPECEFDRDGCATQPCSPLRKCSDIPADLHQALGVGYNCSDCPGGFTSINDGRCEDIDECSSSNGGCSQICNNTYGTFFCSCFEGYRKQTGLCQDINECSEASNDCDQICSNNIGGYNCSCYEGFIFNSTKRSCEEGIPPSECNYLNCSGTSGCTTDEIGNATCFCTKGYQLSSDGETCNDINECQLPMCQHRCTNTEGSFSCSCFNGYIIESDRSSCKPCELPKYGENCNNTCKCGQGTIRCDHIKGCICSEGWTGTNCDEDVDECLEPNKCNDSFKICSNTKGSYMCSCIDGYMLNTIGSCTDLDECNDPVLNTCQQVCKNEAGGFSCSCFYGYIQSRNGTNVCEDIDECTVGQSGCEQLCQNSDGRYTCDCYFGYILNSDRKTCTKVNDLCATFGNINCSQICVLKDGQVFCSCETGYKLSSDNQTCEDINECEDQQLNRCSNNCTNENAGYACSCTNGLQLDNDGRTCKACDAFHYGPNCSHPCSCGVGAERCDPITGCVCKDGWLGTKCDQDMNECVTNPCTGANSSCINTVGSYVCNCLLGYRNVSGVCQEIVECNDPRLNECNHICHNNIGSYSCSCHEGFVSNGTVCSDFDECTGHHNCSHHCVNTEGSYRCKCNKGFKLSESDLSTCIPCKANKYGQDCTFVCACHMPNTQTCDSVNGTCLCREGWEGTQCNIDLDECSSSSSLCGAANMICVNRPGSYSCECEQGYVINSGTQCSDLDECAAFHTCSHQCVNTVGSYRCSCHEGFQLAEWDNRSCLPCESNTYGQDCTMNCTCYAENTQSCDTVNGTCLCREGWTGVKCSIDVDECSNTSSPCDVCINSPGSFSCECERGYIRNDGQCIDLDECAALHNCSHQCVNTVGSYRCSCHEGFQLDESDNRRCLPTSPIPTSTTTPTTGTTTSPATTTLATTANTISVTISDATPRTSKRTTSQATTTTTTSGTSITSVLNTSSTSVRTTRVTSTSAQTTDVTLIPTTSTSAATAGTTSDTTTTSESTTSETIIPTTSTTSETSTTLLLTISPSLMTSTSPTNTLAITTGVTTTSTSSTSVTTMGTSKTTSRGATTATSESTTSGTTTPVIATTSEITTNSVLITTPSSMPSTSPTSKGTPTTRTTNTTTSSSSMATVGTSKTISSGATTATSESATPQTATPATATTSKTSKTSVLTTSPSLTTSTNPTRTLTLTTGVTTTPTASTLKVTMGTNNATTRGATTTFEYSTSQTSKPTTTTTSTSKRTTLSTLTKTTSQTAISPSSTSKPDTTSTSQTSTVSRTPSPSTSTMTGSSDTTTSIKETTTSTAVCTINTFGMNCSLPCSCNISNAINENQTCDPNNGTCLCKEGWMGVNCSQDINECEIKPGVCEKINNSGCYNIHGSYKCLCHIGYISNGNRTCIEDVPKTTTPITVDATQDAFRCNITLNFNLRASIDIKVPENYATIETDVQDAFSEFYRTKMEQLFVRVIIISIRRGSLIVEYIIVTKDSEDALLKLANANAKLAAGEKISLAGQNSSTLRLSAEGNDLPNVTSADQVLCKSYQSLKGDCSLGYECVVIDNRPTCTLKKKEDNFVLIVAVGTGTSLSVILILVIVAVVVYKRKTKHLKTAKEFMYRSDNISNRTNQSFATKWHTSDWMKNSSYGLNPSDMLGHGSHDNKQNYYQGIEEGNKKDNLSGSVSGHEVSLSACKEEFKIKRPKVYGVRNVAYDNGTSS